MDRSAALEQLLRSFEAYYNVKRDGVAAPFDAEAEFQSHDEQYFLMRSARIGEADSREYVYFAALEQLDEETLLRLDETAWNRGLERVVPHAEHRNSDITLFLIADHITEDAFRKVSKLRHYKSYRFSLQGWSHYRLVALELSTGRIAHNRQGQSLVKLVRNICNRSDITKKIHESCLHG